MAERINAVKTSFFGKGAIRLLGPELQKMGIRRALLVTDRFLYDSGAAARVGQVLSDAGVEYAVYYNVQPNPTVQVVNDCIAAARTLQVQLLVALGGGSAIDTAKAASIVVSLKNEDKFKEMKSRFFGLMFTDGNIVVRMLESVREPRAPYPHRPGSSAIPPAAFPRRYIRKNRRRAAGRCTPAGMRIAPALCHRRKG